MKNGEMRPGPFFEQNLVLALDDFESADAAADVDADAFGDLGRHFQAGDLQREIRRRDGELDEAPHLLDFFFLDVTARDRSPSLPGDAASESRRHRTA